MNCVESGVYLIDSADRRLAILVCRSEHGLHQRLVVEIMSPDRDVADQCLGDLRNKMRALNVYRGKVISLSADPLGNNMKVQFHMLREVGRDQIVLPDGLLEHIERQTVGFFRQRDALSAAGRHLKRGVLLHGPPGTGKTLTAMFLAKQMSERTTILVTAKATNLLEKCCALARLLQPSMIVLEDVDLIAGARTRQAMPLCLWRVPKEQAPRLFVS